MKLLLNKRGMFFTLMSMLLIGLITLVLISPPKNVTGIERIEPVTTRISVLSDLVHSLETIYIRSIIQTTMYNILENEIIMEPDYPYDIDELNDFIKTKLESTEPELTSFRYWFNELSSKINEVHHTNLSLTNFEFVGVSQHPNSPFSINVEYRLGYTLNEGTYPFWNKSYTQPRHTSVSIIGMIDPDYESDRIFPLEEIGLLQPADRYIVHEVGKTFLNRITQSEIDYDVSNRICSLNTHPTECTL